MSKAKKKDENVEEQESYTPEGGNAVLDLSADDIEEVIGFALLEEAEYNAEVISMVAKYTKSNKPAVVVRITPQVELEGDERVGTIMTYLNLPYGGCLKDTAIFFRNELAGFRQAFGIGAGELTEAIQLAFQELGSNEELDEFPIDAFEGQVGRVLLKVSEEEGYEPRNEIKKFLVG